MGTRPAAEDQHSTACTLLFRHRRPLGLPRHTSGELDFLTVVMEPDARQPRSWQAGCSQPFGCAGFPLVLVSRLHKLQSEYDARDLMILRQPAGVLSWQHPRFGLLAPQEGRVARRDVPFH